MHKNTFPLPSSRFVPWPLVPHQKVYKSSSLNMNMKEKTAHADANRRKKTLEQQITIRTRKGIVSPVFYEKKKKNFSHTNGSRQISMFAGDASQRRACGWKLKKRKKKRRQPRPLVVDMMDVVLYMQRQTPDICDRMRPNPANICAWGDAVVEHGHRNFRRR